MKTIIRLTSKEMKKILGGAVGGIGQCNTSVTCSDDTTLDCKCSSGTCESGTDYVKCTCDGKPEVTKRCSENPMQ